MCAEQNCELCLTAVYVWKCMLCVRGCANVVTWRFLCISDGVRVHIPSLIPLAPVQLYMYVLDKCGWFAISASAMIQLLLVPMLLHVLLLNSFSIFLNQSLFQKNRFIAVHFEQITLRQMRQI